jgi:hypothetical protein
MHDRLQRWPYNRRRRARGRSSFRSRRCRRTQSLRYRSRRFRLQHFGNRGSRGTRCRQSRRRQVCSERSGRATDCDKDTSVVSRQNEIVALQNARHHSRKRPNVSPIEPLIEIDQRLVIHIECTAHSAEDILDRAITSLNYDGLRAAVNLDFGENRSWSSRPLIRGHLSAIWGMSPCIPIVRPDCLTEQCPDARGAIPRAAHAV